jgi:hypothetical protein
MINKEHIKYSSLSDEALATISGLHSVRDQIVELARQSEDIAIKLYPLWVTNEFILQDLWGFKRDTNYHRSWEYPYCKCPKMDNEDAYPYRRYVAGSCKLHNDL